MLKSLLQVVWERVLSNTEPHMVFGALGWITWPILFGYSWVVSCSTHIKDFQSLAEDSNLCNLPTLFSLAEAEKSSN